MAWKKSSQLGYGDGKRFTGYSVPLLRTIDRLIITHSFVLPPSSTLFDRRASKLTSTIVSTFTAYYILHWPTFFPSTPLTSPRGPVSFETSPPNGEPPEERHAAGEGSSDADAREDLDIGVLRPVPTFDARAVAHPTMQNLRDYLSWRQVDCTSALSFLRIPRVIFAIQHQPRSDGNVKDMC